MTPFDIITNQLYLLQLENYNLPRYWRLFWRRGFLIRERRQALVWTNKLRAIFALSMIIYIYAMAMAAIGAPALALPFWLTVGVAVVAGWLLFGTWAILATLLLAPFDYLVKQRVIRAATRAVREHPKLKVIAITGSYGKTTMKEVVAAALSERFIVIKTDENKNTPLGVARLILEKLTPQTEILLLEMGAYRRGEIAQLCAIARPHISILTGINESHLERFGSLAATIAAKFEIVTCARDQATVILNADDERVSKHYHDYTGGRNVLFYSAYNDKRCPYHVANKRFAYDDLTQHADITRVEDTVGSVKTSFLGEYIFGDIIAARMVARELRVSAEDFRRGIAKLKPIAHRLQPIAGQNGILVIDDSYNGSAHGVEEAIRVLERFKDRRKLYVTPGLVETGDQARALHERIGKRLARVADVVILINNSVTHYIVQGLLANGFAKKDIIFFPTAVEAHREMQKITKPGDVVLFQNDWPDNYS